MDSNGSSYIVNSIFIRNSGDRGIEVKATGSSVNIHNVTIADNPGGGIRCSRAANVRNSIIWGNSGIGTGVTGILCSIRHTNLQAWHLDSTNTYVNPVFTVDGTYHLQPSHR